MMNYEIFKEVVKEKFMDYMPDNFKGMELVVMPVEKVNMTYDGISIRGKDTNISPTIYINDMYEKSLFWIISSWEGITVPSSVSRKRE